MVIGPSDTFASAKFDLNCRSGRVAGSRATAGAGRGGKKTALPLACRDLPGFTQNSPSLQPCSCHGSGGLQSFVALSDYFCNVQKACSSRCTLGKCYITEVSTHTIFATVDPETGLVQVEGAGLRLARLELRHPLLGTTALRQQVDVISLIKTWY